MPRQAVAVGSDIPVEDLACSATHYIEPPDLDQGVTWFGITNGSLLAHDTRRCAVQSWLECPSSLDPLNLGQGVASFAMESLADEVV